MLILPFFVCHYFVTNLCNFWCFQNCEQFTETALLRQIDLLTSEQIYGIINAEC